MRSLILAVSIALVAAACGSDGPTLSEYATQVEELVVTMNAEIDALDHQNELRVPVGDQIDDYFAGKLAARDEFIDAFESLDVPEEALELHQAALDVVVELTTAEETLAERVADAAGSLTWDEIWATPEAIQTTVVDEQAIAICQAAQSEMGSSDDRAVFGDNPWIPEELRDVVVVFFGCTAEERGRDS
jgi:hypothetical protein